MSLKNVLKVKDPKLSRVLIVQNNVYAAVHGVIGEDRLQEACSFLLFPVNVFRPKFAAAELPTNLRNVQPAFLKQKITLACIACLCLFPSGNVCFLSLFSLS